MCTIYKRVSLPLKLLIKLIALVLIPIPGALMLVFTAGSFLLTIIAGLCSIASSIMFLSLLIMIFMRDQGFTLQMYGMGFGCIAFMMLVSILITVCQSAIQLVLVSAVAYLISILTAPLKTEPASFTVQMTETVRTIQITPVPNNSVLTNDDKHYNE